MEHYTLIGIAVILGVMLIFYIVYKIMFRDTQKPSPNYDNHRNRDDDDDDEDDEDDEIHWFLEEDLY